MEIYESNGMIYGQKNGESVAISDGNGNHLNTDRLHTIIAGRNREVAPTPADILWLRGMLPELEAFYNSRVAA